MRTVNLLPWPENMNHVVVDYDGSALRVYVNGSPAPVEILHAAGGNSKSDGPMEIASFKGKLDDLRIYSRELKPNEITFLQSQESLRAVLSILPDKRSKEQKAWIRDYYLTQAAPMPTAKPGLN